MQVELWDNPNMCGHCSDSALMLHGRIPDRIIIPVCSGAPSVKLYWHAESAKVELPTYQMKSYDLFCILHDRAVYFCRQDVSLDRMFLVTKSDRCFIYAWLREEEFMDSLQVTDEMRAGGDGFVLAVNRIAAGRKPKRLRKA
jgi:hypothetical protein